MWKKRWIAWAWASGCIWCWVGPTYAQQTGASTIPEMQIAPVASASEAVAPGVIEKALGFDELAGLATANNPTLAQAAAAIRQTLGTQWQVGLYPNPQLGYLRSDPSQAGQSRTDGVFIGQEIVTAGKRWKSRDVEAQEVARLRWEYQSQERRVLNDLRIRYIEVLATQQSLQLLDELVRIAEAGQQNTEQRRQGEQASLADVLQARIQVKTVRVRRTEAEVRAEAAWRQLVNVAGVPELGPTPVTGSLEGEIAPLDWDACWQRLLAESPQLRAAETRIAHARNEVVRERAQRIPNVTVQVVNERDHSQGYSTTSTFVAVPVPIFNRNQGNIAHAEADVGEARAELRRTQLALRDQLTETFRRYETLRRQIEQLQREILPDVDQSLQLVTTAYRAGEVTVLQLLSSQESYFDTRLTQLTALAELRKTQTEIDGLLLTGGLNPAAIGTALQSQAGFGAQGLLNQLRDENTKQLLPPAFQVGQ